MKALASYVPVSGLFHFSVVPLARFGYARRSVLSFLLASRTRSLPIGPVQRELSIEIRKTLQHVGCTIRVGNSNKILMHFVSRYILSNSEVKYLLFEFRK